MKVMLGKPAKDCEDLKWLFEKIIEFKADEKQPTEVPVFLAEYKYDGERT